jgi:hypothetical protein
MVVVFWLLLGDAGSSLRDRAWSDMMNLLLKRLGSSNTSLAVLTVVLGNVIVLLVGPTISYKSDRLPKPPRAGASRSCSSARRSRSLAMLGIAYTPELGHACATCRPRTPR